MTGTEIRVQVVFLRHEYRRRCAPIRAWHDAEVAKLQAQCPHAWEELNPELHEYRQPMEICRWCEKVRRKG